MLLLGSKLWLANDNVDSDDNEMLMTHFLDIRAKKTNDLLWTNKICHFEPIKIKLTYVTIQLWAYSLLYRLGVHCHERLNMNFLNTVAMSSVGRSGSFKNRFFQEFSTALTFWRAKTLFYSVLFITKNTTTTTMLPHSIRKHDCNSNLTTTTNVVMGQMFVWVIE